MRIRAAVLSDDEFIGQLSVVFAPFGDYRRLLPEWFRLPGVMTFVSEADGQRTGYVMLAFFRESQLLVGDILAIGVAPAFQDRGVGRTLLQHAIEVCERVAENSPVRALRLSVAQNNSRARHLFESCGFQEVQGDFGLYDGGQRALHLERPTRSPAVLR